MNRVHLRPAARADIEAVVEYIAQDSPSAAKRFVDNMRQTLQELADSPGIGHRWRSENLLLQSVHCWQVRGFRNYLVFYRKTRTTIEVIRVLHAARNLPEIMSDE